MLLCAALIAPQVVLSARVVDPSNKLQELGVKMIDKRVGAINMYDGFLSKTRYVSQPTLDEVKGELSRVNGELSALKAKISEETDVAALKSDIKSIVNNYRVFQVFLPQAAGFVAVDRLLTFQNKLVELSNKIGQKANDLEAEGKDVAQILALVQSAGAKLDSAGGDITEASSKFSAMTIADVESSRALKLEGRTSLLNARKNFSDARADLKQAVLEIKKIVK